MPGLQNRLSVPGAYAMTFNPADALTAAKLCQLAYDKPTLRYANTQVRVDYAPDQIDITIPGTNDRRDVLQDALILQRDLGQGQFAHRGFASHWAALRPVMGAAMLAHARPKTIRAQSHSLGSACTGLMIAATPKWFAGATVHMFGCPQFGNSNLAEIFERNCRDLGITVWRVVNLGDPVARINFPGDWQHVGQLVEIGQDGDSELDHPIASYIRDLEAMV